MAARITGETQLIGRDASDQALSGSPNFYGANMAGNEILFGYSGDIRTGPGQIPGFGNRVGMRNWITGDTTTSTLTRRS